MVPVHHGYGTPSRPDLPMTQWLCLRGDDDGDHVHDDDDGHGHGDDDVHGYYHPEKPLTYS